MSAVYPPTGWEEVPGGGLQPLDGRGDAVVEPVPRRLSLDETVNRFASVEKGDLKSIFAIFKETAPPMDKIDQGLLYEELRKVLAQKGVSSPGRHIEAWLKKADAVPDGGGRVDDLIRDAEPLDSEVDGAELIDDLVAYFDKFMDTTEEAMLAAALWTMFTYAFDLFDIAPNLVFGAPTKGCGKSTFLDLEREVAARALVSSSITGPALFRTIEKYKPTLLIDEGDRFLALNPELQAILNAGHKRSMAYVIRTVGDTHEPGVFRTWAPKALTAIGPLPDQIASRSIRIELARMSRAVERTKMPASSRNISAASEGLPARCARWAGDNAIALRSMEPAVVPGLHLRDADNWEPLLAIAHICGPDVFARATKAAVLLVHAEDQIALSDLLLAHIHAAFEEAGHPAGLWTHEILRHLVHRDDGPWPSWWGGDVALGRYEGPGSKMARMLKPFGVGPKDIRRGGEVRRGYERAAFEPLWVRYIDVHSPEGAGGRYTTTPQVDGHLEPLPGLDLVAPDRASDQARSDVAASEDDRGPSACVRCGGIDTHWHWCEEGARDGRHR